jgi:hypothetical protein
MTQALHELVLAIVGKASSLRPMASKDIWIALRKTRPETTPDELPDVLEYLTNSRVLATCRITRGDITQDTYWPTGLRNPVLIGAPPMSNPNTSASKLLRAIVLHGPITGADLAIKTGIAAKSIDSLLESATTRDAVTSRRGFCAEKGRELKHYMTTTQAGDWDAREAAAEQELADAVKDEPNQNEPAAHVMSTPASTKQTEGEIPVNESDEGNEEPCHNCPANPEPEEGLTCAREEIAELKTRVHDLLNDAAGAHLVLQELAKKLSVEKFEDIPSAFDELTQALAARAMHPEPASGRMALVLIDSAELTEIELISADDDAQAMAMSNIELGHAARVLVVRIMGEARRQAEWKEAA